MGALQVVPELGHGRPNASGGARRHDVAIVGVAQLVHKVAIPHDAHAEIACGPSGRPFGHLIVAKVKDVFGHATLIGQVGLREEGDDDGEVAAARVAPKARRVGGDGTVGQRASLCRAVVSEGVGEAARVRMRPVVSKGLCILVLERVGFRLVQLGPTLTADGRAVAHTHAHRLGTRLPDGDAPRPVIGVHAIDHLLDRERGGAAGGREDAGAVGPHVIVAAVCVPFTRLERRCGYVHHGRIEPTAHVVHAVGVRVAQEARPQHRIAPLPQLVLPPNVHKPVLVIGVELALEEGVDELLVQQVLSGQPHRLSQVLEHEHEQKVETDLHRLQVQKP